MTTPNTPCSNPKPFGGERGHPNYEANENKPTPRGYHPSVDEVCCYCGKYVGSPKRYAYLTSMGEWTTIEECNPDDFLGFYPLGTDCASKLRKVGVPVYKATARFGEDDFEAKLMKTPKGVTPLITRQRPSS